jgi:crotonobetainyl-CoA:carnitine CoA-transferase CaiB-like acyl-CoA transferase
VPPALEGITVLDFTRLLPGPFCTQLLCNLGADVIKIEDPKLGDYMRSVPPIVHDVSYPFLMVNRGKRSLAVDLKTPEGQEIVHKLARRADVVVEQFRPGVMARLGAAYDDLAMMNPKLVYCSFSGYGQTGPYRDLPGHDINFQALAGILSVTAGQDDKRPAIPGVPIADMASAFNAALAILAALRTRDRIGRGEWIDVSILDTAVTLMVLGLARFLATGDEPVPGETLLTGVFPFYSLYETKDGRWLSVAAVEPKFWIRMCELVGAPELSERQFADGAERVAAAQTLAARFRERTSEDWGALFAKEQLPITLVKRVSEVVRDPHVMARELLPLIDVPDVGKLQVIAHPAKHAETKVRDPARVPGKGGNTVEILRSLGYTPRQIQAMAKKEVIGT